MECSNFWLVRANNLAVQLAGLERANDFGGRHRQLSAELAGHIYAGGWYRTPARGRTRDAERAVNAWIGRAAQ